MDRQFTESARSGTPGVHHGFGRAGPPLSAVHTVQAGAGPRTRPGAGSEDDYRAPSFAAPGLVLVAALAIFEGYHWLHLFPGSPLRPTAILFALFVAPATFGLTRLANRPPPASVLAVSRMVARVSSVVVLVLVLLVAVDHTRLFSRVLGTTSLVLAVSLVVLVVASERRLRPPTPTD